MRRWIGLAARLYPREWRAEFEGEFRAVLDDVRPSWRVFANVVRGAVEMRMVDGRHWAKLVAAMAVAGALVGFGVSYRSPVYVSSATFGVTPVVDPVRPASAEVLRERALGRVEQIKTAMLTRSELSSSIMDPSIVLDYSELQRKPLEDVVNDMRRDIRIEELSPAHSGRPPIVFGISFAYPDAAKAQAVVRDMATKFTTWNGDFNRMRDVNYADFWRRMSVVKHVKSVPPPPTGDAIAILTPASPPVKSDPNRFPFLAWGAGIGTLLGILATFVMRWPRHTRRIAVFASAGFVVAFAASFLIQNRYTSTAILGLQPAQIAENPFADLPAGIPASEYLRAVEPELLSSLELGIIIEDRRLELYPEERTAKSMDEVAAQMRANLDISPVNSGSAFRISFTYPDRFKAQQAVAAIISQFENLNQKRGIRQQVTTERKAGEILDVLDVASLPIDPVFPHRWMFAAAGFGLGVLIGVITLRFRKPGMPAIAGDQGANTGPARRPEGPLPAQLLQLKVDGADYGFRAG